MLTLQSRILALVWYETGVSSRSVLRLVAGDRLVKLRAQLSQDCADGRLYWWKVDGEVVGLRGDGRRVLNHDWWHLLHLLLCLEKRLSEWLVKSSFVFLCVEPGLRLPQCLGADWLGEWLEGGVVRSCKLREEAEV